MQAASGGVFHVLIFTVFNLLRFNSRARRFSRSKVLLFSKTKRHCPAFYLQDGERQFSFLS
jgi:hypothetical protein